MLHTDVIAQVATLWYRSPDVLMGSRTYGTSIDMWSSGCLFVEMFLGDAPFRGKTEAEQLMYIVRVIGTPNQQVLDSIAPDYVSGFCSSNITPAKA